MLRNLNKTRNGKRILGTPYVGVLGSTVPTAGPPYALAYNDVITDALQANQVRIWVTSHTFPAGFFVNEDTSYTAPNLVDGLYTADGYLIVDDVDILDSVQPLLPYRLLTVQVGTSGMTATLGLSISSVPSIASTALIAAIISATAAFTISSTPSLNVQAGSQQTISATASLTIASTPAIAVQAGLGGSLTALVALDISSVPGFAGSVSIGFELPVAIAASRTATVDLDSDATHPAAVFIKDPQSTLDYGIDITAWLADAQDSLLSFSITPTVGSDITVHAVGLVGELMAAMISGGTVGASNAALFDFTTVNGRHDQRTIYFQIEER